MLQRLRTNLQGDCVVINVAVIFYLTYMINEALISYCKRLKGTEAYGFFQKSYNCPSESFV